MQDKKLYALHNGFFANVRTQIVTIRGSFVHRSARVA